MRWPRLLVIPLVVLLASCGKKAKDEIDYGRLEGRTYSHDFFAFQIDFPADWVIQSKDTNEFLMNQGGDLLAGDDANAKRVYGKAIEQNTINLFTVFEHEIGAPVQFNPSVLSIAEKLSQFPGIKTGADYLFHMKAVLDGSSLEVEYPKEVYSQVVGGKEFFVLEDVMHMQKMQIRQKIFVRVADGYCLCFILSYIDDAQLDAVSRILDTLDFVDV